MEIEDIIKQNIEDSVKVKQALLSDEKAVAAIVEAVDACVSAYRNGGKIMWCGNGGSAADAQHMAGELVNKLCFDRPGLPSISLGSDPSVVTSISNDYGFAHVFSHQVQAQGSVGDVLIGISTSGNSVNIVEAIEAAWQKHITTIAITGASSCKMDKADIVIKVPSKDTPRIQECQTLIGHIICSLVEKSLFPSLDPENLSE